MPKSPTNIFDETGIALGNLADAATGTLNPTMRLGVTGLSRAGKTVFITALIHNLLTGARLPGFTPMANGQLVGAQLAEHPDRGMPRFAYEQHLAALTGSKPHWPESTSRISQIRLVLKFQSNNWLSSMLGTSQLTLDIVDYPGEWLLDLPLLSLSFAEWSEQALVRAQRPASKTEAKPFLDALSKIDTMGEARDTDAETLAKAFTQYLASSRQDGRALSTLPPGRFLMPGDMAGSPALTFAPLPTPDKKPDNASLYAMLERRFEAYKNIVVRPFFRDHFARLDRQIVLVDTLRALNAGKDAVADLETALTEVLACFRAGSSNIFTQLVSKRIDKILFAATKADHIHHTSHDWLEAILNRLLANAARRAKFAGAETRSLAIAAIRATSEGTMEEQGETLATIIGTPQKGETLDETTYDGETEIALFPGDLPENPESVFQSGKSAPNLNFLRFVPPQNLQTNTHGDPVLPHIRLDRAMDYLLGDWMK